jgi:gliding motility-associated-like protein
MDELRLWNRSLSADEIRAQMCRKLDGNEPGLIGYWDFDDTSGNTLIDKSPNHFDGLLMGNPKRVFSGAPIGDESITFYTTDWEGKELVWNEGPDKVRIGNVRDNPAGVHIYKVGTAPSQTKGLNLSTVDAAYFGVFAANLNTNSTFDLTYTYNDSAICRLFTRPDNATPGWSANLPALTDIVARLEVVKEKWNSVLDFSLGADQELCTFRSIFLNPLIDTANFQFLWIDGSSGTTFEVTDFGTYWGTVNNGCTEASDTLVVSNIAVEDISIPNIITPNGDFANQYFEIDSRILGGSLKVDDRWGKEVYQSSHYQNNWDGADVASGIYFYLVKGGACVEERKGTLTILR